jgi:hypothetical protein
LKNGKSKHIAWRGDERKGEEMTGEENIGPDEDRGLERRGEESRANDHAAHPSLLVNKNNILLNLGHKIWTCLRITMHRFLFI